MTTEKTPKNPTIFICENCDFKSSNKKDYKRHLDTAKHKKQHLTTEEQQKNLECICGKKYKERTALYRHKKKCTYKTPEEKITEILLQQQEEQRRRDEQQNEERRKRDEVQMRLIEEHHKRDEEQREEHKQQIEVLTEKISGMSLVTNHNTINNNTNNTFNLKFFLNTQCKDAIDFNSFLRSIKVDNEDLDMFDNNGYIAGMMNVLERNLYSMRIEDRPIHCTDKKRKTIYYKKENGDWEKDGDKVKMPYLIDHIENVSNNYFEKIYKESGGLGDNDTESLRYKWYIKMTFATTGGDYESSKVNHTRIMGLLTDEIYVKVVKTDKIRS
jgi:stress-induced morphogen